MKKNITVVLTIIVVSVWGCIDILNMHERDKLKELVEAQQEKIKIMDEQNYKLFRALDYCTGVNK